MGSKPLCASLDTFKCVTAVYMPYDIFLAADFAATRPAGLFKATNDFRGEKGSWGRMDGFFEGAEVGGGDLNGQACVGELKVAGQAKGDVGEGKVCWDNLKGDAFGGGALLEDFLRRGGLRNSKGWNVAFHDAAFVPGDLFDGVAQYINVVYAQASDACNCGRD